MKVRMRAISSYLFHDKLVRPGDIIEGTTSEYEWLRGADCAVKICDVPEPDIQIHPTGFHIDRVDIVETQMVDTEKRTERRVRGRK